MANQINSLVGTGAEFYADSIVVTDGEALGDLTGGCDPDQAQPDRNAHPETRRRPDST
jgi:hypothetical protein